MRLIPADINEVKRPYARINDLILEFHESNLNCVKVEGYTQKTAFSCANSLRVSAKRLGLFHIKAMVRKDNVYLIKEEI
jgi:hypothetical protein